MDSDEVSNRAPLGAHLGPSIDAGAIPDHPDLRPSTIRQRLWGPAK
jgi:hypothetical protein